MKLSKEKIKIQKELLLKEKVRLEKETKTLKKYPDYGNLGDDDTQEFVDYENNMSIEGQLNLLLKKVDKALGAIEEGTYGQCRKCSQAIESGRLKLMPYAELCATCQTKKK